MYWAFEFMGRKDRKKRLVEVYKDTYEFYVRE